MKKLTLLFTVVALTAGVALAAPDPKAAAAKADAKKDEKKADEKAKPAKLTPEERKKTLYALGLLIGQRTPLGQADLTAEEADQVLKGFTAAAQKKTLDVKMEEAGPLVDRLLAERAATRADSEKKKGAEYLEKAAAEAGAQKQPSGLIYFETKAGTGPQPAATDTVRVHYKGTLTNGKEFDSSYKRNEPTQFPLNGVIKCWTEGVGKMKVGGKAKLVCPPEIAYGERGAGGVIPPNAVLTFEVELIAIPTQDAGVTP